MRVLISLLSFSSYFLLYSLIQSPLILTQILHSSPTQARATEKLGYYYQQDVEMLKIGCWKNLSVPKVRNMFLRMFGSAVRCDNLLWLSLPPTRHICMQLWVFCDLGAQLESLCYMSLLLKIVSYLQVNFTLWPDTFP